MTAILEQRILLPALLLSLSLLAPSRGWAHQVPAAVRDPTLMGFLTSWNFRAEVMLVLAVLASAYTRGWWCLQKQGQRGTARRWRAASYLTGLTVVGLALLSSIDRLASILFTLHMVQHLLLVMVTAPLLLLADPLLAFLWALPRRTRHRVGRLFRDGAIRRGLWSLTWMPVAWLVFVGNLWAWHHPTAYQAALRRDVIHDLEHLTFFGTALLFWWPIINPAPRVHGRIHPSHPTFTSCTSRRPRPKHCAGDPDRLARAGALSILHNGPTPLGAEPAERPGLGRGDHVGVGAYVSAPHLAGGGQALERGGTSRGLDRDSSHSPSPAGQGI